MKRMKKVFAFLLTMVMVLAMAVPAMAASITINPDDSTGTDNNIYTAYKIFDAVKSSDKTKVAYSVASVSTWLSVLQNDNQTWVTLTASADGSTYTITATDDMDAEGFAAYLKQNIPSGVTGTTIQKNSETGKYDISNIDEGYYLITSSLGTKLILDTTKTTEIKEKNKYPGDKKEAETGSVSIGGNVTYYVTVTVPANVDTSKSITVHDQMNSNLKFNNDVKVYEATTPTSEWSLEQKKGFTYSDLATNVYTVATTGDTLTTGDTFTITINTANLAGKTIVFKYTAELLSSADADGDGYVNKEFLNYSNYTSTPKTSTVKTYDFNVKKTDADGKELSGAEFELRTNATDTATAIEFTEKNGGYKKADSNSTTKTKTLSAGAINIEGLGAGTYYLVETKAPDGYNKLQSPITVVISDEGTITFTIGDGNTGTSAKDDTVTVANYSGAELPSTGGIGTTLFYVIGAICVLGAGVLLVTRRRMASK